MIPTQSARRPPGPRAPASLWAFWSFAADPPGYLQRLARTHGGVARFPLGPRESFVLATSHAAIDSVLRDQAGAFRKDGMTRRLGRIVGQGLLTMEGDAWRQHRRLLAPLFQPERVDRHAAMITRHAREYVALLTSGQRRDVHADMQRLTARVIGEVLLGCDIADETDALARSLDLTLTSFQRLMQTWRRLVPEWVPLRDRARVSRARVELDGVLERTLARRHAHGPGTVAELLGRDGHAAARELRDELATLLLAGHETTASTLACALFLLARHPDVAGQLRSDLRAASGGRAQGPAAQPEVPLLDAVVRETLRLHPPAWILGREALRDCDLVGFRVRRGEEVVVSPWVQHRDPEWFPEPDAFRPRRWLTGLEQSLPRHVYMPFGGGARACVGSHLALLEARLVLAEILRDWELRTLDDEPLDLLPSITLRPRSGVLLQLQRAT